MNSEQLQYLKALEIPVWIDKQRQQAQDVQASYAACLVDAHQWQNLACQALFAKIIAAMKWPSFDVVHAADKVNPHSQIVIAFGEGLVENLDDIQVIEVQSLKSMLKSVDAKKTTWQRLKPYALP